MEKKVELVKHLPIFKDRRKYIGIYCRVSTQHPAQLCSLGNQIEGLIREITKHKLDELYDVYLDIKSGRDSDDRKGMNRLIDDCRSGKVNFVVTKSMSRLARNTVDVLSFVRELKKYNVPVYFVNEDIYSLDPHAEFMISLMGAVAQGESEEKSRNIKWGIEKQAKNPDSALYNRKCYGYTNDDNGNLVIKEDEAKVIRSIFEMYLAGMSITRIKKSLEDQHILTSTGKAIWPKRSIETILANEKYTGDVLVYKTFTAEYPSKKRITNIGQQVQYEQNEHHDAIIPKEMFIKVQEERYRRSNIEIDDEGNKVRKKTRYQSK